MQTPPLYVKTLFEFLRTLGVTQQMVAHTLGASKTAVSFWANGKQPLSPRYAPAFLDLVAEAAAEPAEPPAHYTPSSITEMLMRLKTVQQYLTLWTMERQLTLGAVERDYRQGCRIIASYAQQDPTKLDPAQWHEIRQACRDIEHASRILTYLRQPPPATNGPHATDLSRDTIRTALQEIAEKGHLQAPAEETHDDA